MRWADGELIRLNVGDVSLEGKCIGPPPGEAATFILLHEGLGSIALWRDFPEQLSAQTGCGVFVYSRQGYGYSNPVSLPRPLDYMTREATDVLPEILSHIDIKSCILLGHSDGASIAAIYAGTVIDDRIKGVILMAPHFFAEQISIDAINLAKEAFESQGLKERLSRYHADVDGAFKGWNDAWLDPDFLNWNIENVIGRIKSPVLAIQGKGDQYGTLKQIDSLETGLCVPFEKHIIEDCGHSPFSEKREETLLAVCDFAEQLGLAEHAVEQ